MDDPINFTVGKPYEGRYDAMALSLSLGNGKRNFNNMVQHSRSLLNSGEVRDIRYININKKPCLIIAKNNDKPVILEIANENTYKK